MPNTYIPHLKLNMSGTIGTPAVEIWSCTVRFGAGVITPDEDRLDLSLAAAKVPIITWFNSQSAAISRNAALTMLKLNWIMANGKQRSVNTHELAVSALGGISSNTGEQTAYPHWYQTMALTLRTDIQRGRGHSGRIYPPLTAALPAGTSPYVSEAAATGMATAFAQCLSDVSAAMSATLNAAPGSASPCYAIVASAGTTPQNPTAAPLNVPITGVVVDRVGDVQHRRNRQVPRLEGPRAVVTGIGIGAGVAGGTR